MKDRRMLIEHMTKREKAALVGGTRFMYTRALPRLGIGAVSMADGPHGVRKQVGKTVFGMAQGAPATAFPTASALASSFSLPLVTRVGEAIGEECRHYGVHLLLGPGVNIKRDPRGGRNFEYFSEDPLLAGRMGAAEVRGVQSTGVGACVKHFALNNSETYRFMGDSIADERAMQEIYLAPFRTVVTEAKPAAVMNAYNRVAGTFCTENRRLLTELLRDTWGFEGAVMTDWGAMHDRVEALLAGCDLEMPGDTRVCPRRIRRALRDGTLPEEVLDRSVDRILALAERAEAAPQRDADLDAHHDLAVRAATECAVLLKNDGSLPLSELRGTLAVGELYEHMRFQGAGSSMIRATRTVTPKDALAARGITLPYARGYREIEDAPDRACIAEAVRMSEGCERILLFIGLTDLYESEGCDREHIRLPEGQLLLTEALLATGKPVIAVLFGGAPVELPFADRLAALLHMHLCGQGGGEAMARLLLGEVSPSGRLSESYPLTYEDVPSRGHFAVRRELYRESYLVGYRYYLTAERPVRYPFGFGLSYTRFTYRDLSATEEDGTVHVRVTLTNVGERAGAEVVQLYVAAPRTDIPKPTHELRAFDKVYLEPQESKIVNLTFQKQQLSYFDPKQMRWILEEGVYDIRLCSDCQTVLLHAPLHVAGETPPCPYTDGVRELLARGDVEQMDEAALSPLCAGGIPAERPLLPITPLSRFTDLRATRLGRLLYRAVLSVAARELRRAERLPEGRERTDRIKGAHFLRHVLCSGTLLSMSMSAGKVFPYRLACALATLANGHPLRAIGTCLCPPRVSGLARAPEGASERAAQK